MPTLYKDAATFSLVRSGNHSSIAAFTWLQRDLLIARTDRTPLVAAALASADTAALKRRLSVAVRQSLYISERTDAILSRAINGFPEVSEILIRFREEESGHEELIRKSAIAMGCQDTPVLPGAERLLDAFESTAGTSLIAFALGLDAFEGIAYDAAESPLAAHVQRAFSTEAAWPLRHHHHLNRTFQHAGIGSRLLSLASEATLSEVQDAEAFARVINSCKTEIAVSLVT